MKRRKPLPVDDVACHLADLISATEHGQVQWFVSAWYDGRQPYIILAGLQSEVSKGDRVLYLRRGRRYHVNSQKTTELSFKRPYRTDLNPAGSIAWGENSQRDGVYGPYHQLKELWRVARHFERTRAANVCGDCSVRGSGEPQ